VSLFAGEFLGRALLTVAVAAVVAATAAVTAVVVVVAAAVSAAATATATATATAVAAAEKASAVAQKSYYSPTSKPYSARMFALQSMGDSVSKTKPEVGENGSCSKGQEAERKAP
jgi:hypothetical protein